MANPDEPGLKNLRLRLLGLLPVAAAFTLLAFPASASADPLPGTIVVGTIADDGSGTCSLRAAIASVNDGVGEGNCTSPASSGTTTIEVPAGQYNLALGQLQITHSVNIVGGGARSTIIDGGADGQRVFEVASGTVTIGGVTIQHGSTNGATGPEPHHGIGGGIYVDSGATLTLKDSMVSGNEADNSGGGIGNDGTLTILSSTVENNTTGNGGNGGGIINFLSLSVTNSTIMNNAAQADGGGLYLVGSTTLTNDTIANNGANAGLAGGNGGGIFVNGVPTATFQLTNTLLAGNTRNGVAQDCSGGALTSLGGNLSDDGSCGFSGAGDQQNVSPNLAAIDSTAETDVLPLQDPSPAIDAGNAFGCPATDQRYVARPQGAACDIGAVEFTNGPSDYFVSTADELDSALSSQAVFEVPATIHIAAGHYDIGVLTGHVNFGSAPLGEVTLAGAGAANTIFDGDHLSSQVFSIGGLGTSTIKDVTIENGAGDGINENGDVALDNSIVRNNGQFGIESTNQGLELSGDTITGNASDGVFSEGNTVAALNTTIVGNSGNGLTEDGNTGSLENVTIAGNTGFGIAGASGVTLVNTISASNTAGDCDGPVISNGHNLDKDGSCLLNGGNQNPSDFPEVDPQLGPLQDNGGPTPTMALTPGNGNEAIDHGNDSNCPATDQRGITRPQGPQCDIGAYELVEGPAAPQGIAFESDRTGNSEIWTMNPDGTNAAQLTHDGATDSLPSISPDGHTVVYQHTAAGVTQVWAINGDGTDARALTTQGQNSQPTFSPDGTKIAFDSTRNGTSQLFVMNADGSGQTQVTNMGGTVGVGGSSWSPNGSRIAVSDDATGNNEIYTVDAATGTPSAPLTSAGENRDPQWSPDGSEILYVSTNCVSCGADESVFLMNADGTNQHDLTQAPIFDADPAWSPDGAKIAFVRDLGGQNFNVFTANADGTNQVQLTFGSAPSRNSFPDWGTQPSAAGQLAGSFTQSVVKPVDLTAAGTSDWALWSYNTSAVPASLTPNETKASGGRKISDLTVVNGNGTPTRGFGGFADNLVPFNFNWTDGSPDAAVSGGHGGLTAPAVGQGLSFTVPAGKGPQRLTIWTSAHYANGTLTAHLSDGSAPDYSQTIDAEPGQFAGVSENVPTIFTLEYEASGPGQTLTVTWTDDTNNGCPGCDDIVLYGAALDSGLSHLTVNATPSSAGAGIDQVPINLIPNAWISFFAGSTNSAPVGSTPVGSTPVGSTPVGSTPVGSTPVGSTPVGSTPVGSTPVGSTPVGSTGLFDLPVGSTPVGSTALSSVLLSQVQLHGVAWDQILCGSLLNKPLAAVTLQDVKQSAEQCSDGNTSLQHLRALPLSQVDLGTTLLRSVHWATLLIGNTTALCTAGRLRRLVRIAGQHPGRRR